MSKSKKRTVSKDTLIIEEGAVITFKPIPPLAPTIVQENYEKTHPRPKTPTYLVESVPGVKVEMTHTVDSLESTEEKEEWAAYEALDQEWQNGFNQLLLKLFIGEGVTLKIEESVKRRWEKKAALYGIEVPEDEDEYKITMLSFQGIRDSDILQKISEGVLRQTGVPQEELEAANKLF